MSEIYHSSFYFKLTWTNMQYEFNQFDDLLNDDSKEEKTQEETSLENQTESETKEQETEEEESTEGEGEDDLDTLSSFLKSRGIRDGKTVIMTDDETDEETEYD